jgi:antitoxin HigA-1
MPMKSPPHPGDFIRTEILDPAGLSVTATAAALQISRPALSSLLNGKAGLSGAMALRIEKAFGVKMDTLMLIRCSRKSLSTISRRYRRDGASIACKYLLPWVRFGTTDRPRHPQTGPAPFQVD